MSFFFFFFNDTATTEIYTLSLHDALPISNAAPSRASSCTDGRFDREDRARGRHRRAAVPVVFPGADAVLPASDRKSTRLNSSHQIISYAVFCLKKKKNKVTPQTAHDSVLSARDNSMTSVSSINI